MEENGADPTLVHDLLVQVVVVATVGQRVVAAAVNGGIGHTISGQIAVGAEEFRQIHIGGQLGLAQVQIVVACPIDFDIAVGGIGLDLRGQAVFRQGIGDVIGQGQPDGVVAVDQQPQRFIRCGGAAENLNEFQLDILFVMVYDFGAAGAALATVISQGISFVLCNIFLFVKRNELGFKIRADYFIHIDKVMFMNLFKLGLPMAIKSASIHISKLFVNSFINSFGVAVSAFAGVANKINSISNLVSNSLNTAGSSMVGQNVGAKQYSRVPMIMKTMFATVLVIASVMTAVVCLFPMQVFGIFTSDEAVLKIAIEYLPVAAFVFFGCAFRSPMNALINGSGNYKVNFAMALLDGIIMRIGLSALFGIVFGYGYLGFWLGDAIAGFTPFVVGIAFYFTGGWKKQSLEA